MGHRILPFPVFVINSLETPNHGLLPPHQHPVQLPCLHRQHRHLTQHHNRLPGHLPHQLLDQLPTQHQNQWQSIERTSRLQIPPHWRRVMNGTKFSTGTQWPTPNGPTTHVARLQTSVWIFRIRAVWLPFAYVDNIVALNQPSRSVFHYLTAPICNPT